MEEGGPEVELPPVIKTSKDHDIQNRVDEKLTALEDDNLHESLDKTKLELVSANRSARNLVATEIRLEREKERSGIDELTGLLNRKGFDKELKQRINLSKRSGGKLNAIFIDADGLKEINDSQGHEAGDEYLKLIASELKSSTRGTDIVARFGGDEFAIILDDPDNDGLQSWWNRLNENTQIRISAGAILLDLNNPEESIAKADEAMYGAKLNKQDGESHLMVVQSDGNFKEFLPQKINSAANAA